jgi:hypothetical protein
MTNLPSSHDRMPIESRKPRAGPLLDPDEVIAFSLNGVPYKWWRTHKNEPPLSETSEPVRAVKEGLRLAGYKIVPMERGDYR